MIGFEDLFGDEHVLVILRGLPPEETAAAAHAAWDAGAELLEVPIGSPEQLSSLTAAVEAGAKRGKLVGAGTVTSLARARAASHAGAVYTVAPGYDPDVVEASLEAGMPHLPGVATASEVQRACAAGCRWVKVFPASILGPGWFRAMRGPFPDVAYVATGGISLQEAPTYYEAGARVIGVGAAVVTEPTHRDGFLRLMADRRIYRHGG